MRSLRPKKTDELLAKPVITLSVYRHKNKAKIEKYRVQGQGDLN